MNPRSFLFVPGDSEKKLARARDTGADALILDLEDSVAPARKALARDMVATAILTRIAPVTEQIILSFIAERVLGQPKSY